MILCKTQHALKNSESYTYYIRGMTQLCNPTAGFQGFRVPGPFRFLCSARKWRTSNRLLGITWNYDIHGFLDGHFLQFRDEFCKDCFSKAALQFGFPPSPASAAWPSWKSAENNTALNLVPQKRHWGTVLVGTHDSLQTFQSEHVVSQFAGILKCINLELWKIDPPKINPEPAEVILLSRRPDSTDGHTSAKEYWKQHDTDTSAFRFFDTMHVCSKCSLGPRKRKEPMMGTLRKDSDEHSGLSCTVSLSQCPAKSWKPSSPREQPDNSRKDKENDSSQVVLIRGKDVIPRWLTWCQLVCCHSRYSCFMVWTEVENHFRISWLLTSLLFEMGNTEVDINQLVRGKKTRNAYCRKGVLVILIHPLDHIKTFQSSGKKAKKCIQLSSNSSHLHRNSQWYSLSHRTSFWTEAVVGQIETLDA